ncbi:hypothetical protein [Spirillospora sp. CA-294931]|uniref:hypothetical protein n=1 Tax=Spirillospora sp. CA-294931 TaxID=3240042 RepID=UPI003D94C35D
MMKRLAATGLLAMTAGGVLMTAAPAMAHDDGGDQGNVQIAGVQTCRSVMVVPIGAALHNVLGMTNEAGHCNNGSTVDD